MLLVHWLSSLFSKTRISRKRPSREVRESRSYRRQDPLRGWNQAEILEDRTMLSGAAITQLSHATDAANQVSDLPSVNADGTRVAFDSNADLTGQNADGHYEIFLFQAEVGLTQITNDATADSFSPSISDDGTKIAFISDGNFTNQNTDGSYELFLYEVGQGFTQLTDVASPSGGNAGVPDLSGDGSHVAFISDADYTGGNADQNNEVFLLDVTTSNITQITSSTGALNFTAPHISADGQRVTFSSDVDLLGQNADGSDEVFLYDQTSGLSQITADPTADSFGPSISGDGTRIAFDSNGDFAGNNSDGSTEIFFYDTSAATFTQVTDTSATGFNIEPYISGDGTAIAFQSYDNLTGENSESISEMFLFREGQGLIQVTNEDSTFDDSYTTSINQDGTRIGYYSQGNPTGTNSDGSVEVFLAAAGHLVVDTVADESDGKYSIGDLSLREAIELSNRNPDANTITFDAGLAGKTITLTGGALDVISEDLTITGLGADQLTISGNDAVRVFQIGSPSTGTVTAAFSGLRISDGSASNGAGILNYGGHLTVRDSVLSHNTATVTEGGGIRNLLNGTLEVYGSTFQDNVAARNGGGIANATTGGECAGR